MQTFVWVHIDKIEFYIYDPSTSPSLPSVVYCYVLKNYYWFRAMSKRIGAFDILILIFFFWYHFENIKPQGCCLPLLLVLTSSSPPSI